ncbi:glycosyltransferase, partial [Patescibacteria group bacterium]|nr:glycosyltransferase [Patescibacteria group bacterium]
MPKSLKNCKIKLMKKSKILILSLTYLPFIGGAEVAIKEITSHLSGDFSFDMITCGLDKKLPKFEQIGNINIYRVGKGKLSKYFYPYLALKQAKKLYKKNNYKIAWAMMATWAGWAALKIKEKFPEIKYLLTLQSGDSDKFIKKRTWFWNRRYKKIYQKADKIQVISKWLEKRARRFGYKGEISLVPNGVNIELRI